MIKYDNVVNEYTVNIFADASIRTINNETIGCPGIVVILDKNIIHQDTRILRNTTNSEAELYAIYMAINYALQYNGTKVINIFSDSQFAVYGLREWIFKWLNNIKDDTLFNSSKKEVAHQTLFMNIVYTILNNNLKVSIYHNRGHFPKTKIKEFVKLFKKHNFLHDDIEFKLGYFIIEYNDMVDKITRELLHNNLKLEDPLLLMQYMARDDLDMNYYKELLNI